MLQTLLLIWEDVELLALARTVPGATCRLGSLFSPQFRIRQPVFPELLLCAQCMLGTNNRHFVPTLKDPSFS